MHFLITIALVVFGLIGILLVLAFCSVVLLSFLGGQMASKTPPDEIDR